MNSLYFYFLLVLLAAINSTIGNLFLKKASADLLSIQDFFTNKFLILGIFFYAINVIFFVIALKKIPVSIAYPALSGTSFLLLILASVLFFQEDLNSLKIFGAMLIFIGILILASQAGG